MVSLRVRGRVLVYLGKGQVLLLSLARPLQAHMALVLLLGGPPLPLTLPSLNLSYTPLD